jgi:hypothetical protein
MSDIFDVLYENFVNRNGMAGFLPGDFVAIKKNALTHEDVKKANSAYKQALENFIKDPSINLKISAIKPVRAQYVSTGGNMGDTATGFIVDVVEEYAPGGYRGPITVPLEILELKNADWNAMQNPIPDKYKHQGKYDAGSVYDTSYDSGKQPKGTLKGKK